MLPRRNRFSFKRGVPKKTFAHTMFVIRYEMCADQKLECAVVVGKKVDKSAVGRNRLKRLITKIVKELLAFNTPYKMVIYARRPIVDATEETIKEQLAKSLKTLQII